LTGLVNIGNTSLRCQNDVQELEKGFRIFLVPCAINSELCQYIVSLYFDWADAFALSDLRPPFVSSRRAEKIHIHIYWSVYTPTWREIDWERWDMISLLGSGDHVTTSLIWAERAPICPTTTHTFMEMVLLIKRERRGIYVAAISSKWPLTIELNEKKRADFS